jgi:putative hydrolase
MQERGPLSTPEPSGPGDAGGGPFGPGSLADIMRNLARYLSAQGPLNWEIARQMAVWAATGGATDPNPDPVSRVRLESLVWVAELQVAEATGLDVAPGRSLTLATVNRTEWALQTLDDWKPILERLALKMSPALPGAAGASGPSAETPGVGGTAGQELPGGPDLFGGQALIGGLGAADLGGSASDPMARLFSQLPQMIGPFMFGLQAGSMVGQLAARAMGRYDLPMPRPADNSLVVVSSNVDSFASDWSLDPDDVRMWICLREATHHAVLARPHVRARLESLIDAYVDAFEVDAGSFEARLAGVDPMDMASLQEAFADPEALVGEMQSDAQREIQVPLKTLLSAMEGYIDHVMDSVGRKLIASYALITEALRRRRLDEDPGNRVLGRLCGVSLDATDYETGRAFIDGVLERAGEEGLSRLWRSDRELPTPAELAAPGLWLARIDLPVTDQPES